MLPWEVPANGPGETTAAMGVRGCGQERGTHILDVIEAQWWTPSRVLQGLCRKGLIVAMDEAAEGRKVARRLWDRDMPEKGGERGQGPREEPASPRADAHPLGARCQDTPDTDGSLSLPFASDQTRYQTRTWAHPAALGFASPSMKGSEFGRLGLPDVHHQP